MNCPDAKQLSSYLDERLSDSQRTSIEEHISGCDQCLDFIVLAHEAGNMGRRRAMQTCPRFLKDRIRMKLGLKRKKSRRELKWLFAAILLFALSFVVKRYFVQFLVAAAILGFKWVMEGEGAKRAIMIFKGVHPQEKKVERKPPPPVSRVTGGDRYGEGE